MITRRRDQVCEHIFAANMPPTEDAEKAMKRTFAWQQAAFGDACEELILRILRLLSSRGLGEP